MNGFFMYTAPSYPFVLFLIPFIYLPQIALDPHPLVHIPTDKKSITNEVPPQLFIRRRKYTILESFAEHGVDDMEALKPVCTG